MKRFVGSALLAVLWAIPGAYAADAVPNPPQVEARSYILIDNASGQVLAEHDSNARSEPASLTKLMTAYIVFKALSEGRLKLDEPVTISEHAWRAGGAATSGSTSFLALGSKVPAEVLIKGMIVQSGNDATIALAERLGGTESAFVELMNVYAQRLGLSGSHFEDSSGLPSPNHYMTARDVATLARALIREFPQYYSLFSLREFTWNNIRQQNRNGLLDKDPSVDGLKTGHTDSAGYCLATSAKRGSTRVIAVVLGSNSIRGREDASAALLTYGFTFFETVNLKKRGEAVLKPRVYKGGEEFIAVGPMTDINVTVPRGQGAAIQTSATVRRPLLAPLDPNLAVGTLQVTLDGKTLANVPLYPLGAVARGGFWSRLSDTILLWFQK